MLANFYDATTIREESFWPILSFVDKRILRVMRLVSEASPKRVNCSRALLARSLITIIVRQRLGMTREIVGLKTCLIILLLVRNVRHSRMLHISRINMSTFVHHKS